ncbi:MAG: hypothetical protein ABSC54_05750 [Smithellaceae bacterium]|jgi:hypothetical protein
MQNLHKKIGSKLLIITVIFVIFLIYLFNEKPSNSPTASKSIELSPSNQPNSTSTVAATRSDHSDEIIQVDSDTLINAYRTDEESANEQYENRLVAVTGTISGIVTTPDEVLMKAYQRGMVPDAFFIVMGGPLPSSAAQAMQNSGLMAFFGQRYAAIAGQLARGETVTVVCKCNGKMINAIHLGECALQTPRPVEAETDKNSAQGSRE